MSRRRILPLQKLREQALLPEICSYCSAPLAPEAWPRGICPDCLSHIPLRPPGEMRYFSALEEGRFSDSLPLYVFFYYEGDIRRAVTGLKFHERTDFCRSLGDLMALSWRRRQKAEDEGKTAFRALAKAEAILPLPLHKKRLRERGYNQAELLAAPLAEALGLPLYTDLLIRRKATLRQSETKDRRERENNLRDAFICKDPGAVNGRCLVLFDDVSSSGASLRQAARPLLEAGATVILAAMAGNIRTGNSDALFSR